MVDLAAAAQETAAVLVAPGTRLTLRHLKEIMVAMD
jgi:hypothetical protein